VESAAIQYLLWTVTKRYIPARSLKAAGLRSSREASSLSGALHFWQYIVESERVATSFGREESQK